MPSTPRARASLLLKQARHALQLTQTEFGRRMGVTKRTVARWESGLFLNTHATLAQAAHLLRRPYPALASELKEHAHELVAAMGGPRDMVESVGPPLPTPEEAASLRVVHSLAEALGVKQEAARPALEASLAHAESARLTIAELRKLLV